MPELTRSALAEQDLFEIWRFGYERWNEDQADRYLDHLESGLTRLLAHPLLGRSRDDVREGYRSIRIGEHVAFYRVRENDIHIVRVLHGSVALDARFDP